MPSFMYMFGPMTRKGFKLTPETRLKISIGRRNSPILRARKEATRRLKELKRQAKIQERQCQRDMWGNYHSPEARTKISQAKKGCIPWNKGVQAWNNGLEWPEEVKENISRGMIVYWTQRKQMQ